MFSHHQIKTIVATLALACALGLSVSCGGSRAAANKKEGGASAAPTPAVIEVTTAPAVMRNLPRFLEATGALAADEQTDVAPTVAGRVVSVGVDLGSYVGRGAVLARLDDADARLRLEQLQAQAAQAQSGVRQAEARLGLRAGQQFEVTRVAEVGSARTALDLAEKQLRRFEKLLESGDVSRSAYDQQKAQRDQLRQQYESQLAQAQQSYAGVATARAAAQAAAVQVEQAQKTVRDAVVYAPISGFVSDRPVDVGEYVSTSSKVATIVRTNPMRVRIDIPEQTIASVQPGQSVSVSVSSYPQQAFAGRVSRISPNVSATSRTLTVEAEVENGNGLLKPGQFATIRILLPQTEPAILVPVRAVRTEGNTSRIFVIRDGVAQERLVQTGQVEGELIEVRGNIAADEPVAVGNVEQLNDGAAVRQ
ncbi:MAG TPA: efflux RND transporter periplasmic adaptor subunit [Pyrinomonadaceae bacterium]|jgi:multidrug efflux pump subunit AcrA (membrane-fusion protein)|nr:efflux RND transporter periplasmic adaptor subunit [Pyrinomonadaceae bacterium]